MNKRKRGYAEDYELREEAGKNGKTKRVPVYVGNYYRYDMEDRAYSVLKKLFLALTGAEALLFLVMGGVLRVGSMGAVNGEGSFYVMLPYVINLFPVALCLSKAVMLCTVKREMTFAQYDGYVRRFRDMAIALLVLAAASTVGQGIWLIRNWPQAGVQDVLFLLCGGAMVGLGFLLRKIQDRYACVKVEK